MVKEDSQGIKSIEVGYRILEEIASSDQAVAVTELAQRCNMSKSKVHHYLVSFCRIGLLRKVEDSKYCLGQKLAFLGMKASHQLDIHTIIEPHLKELGVRLGESVAFAAWADHHGPYWALKHESTKSLNVSMRGGPPLSLTTTSTGRLFAACYDPEKTVPMFERELRKNGMDRDRYLEDIREIRRLGYSIADGIFQHGFVAVSVPVFDYTGQMAGAVAVVGVSGMIDVTADSRVVQELLKKSREISKALMFNGGK